MLCGSARDTAANQIEDASGGFVWMQYEVWSRAMQQP